MKPPISLGDDQLTDYSNHHLKYELDMLIWTTGIMRTLGAECKKNPITWSLNNSLLNSYSMHARNLIDFLYLRSFGRDRDTDIIVQDFIDQDLLKGKLPAISPILKEAKIKADKQVAHLTTNRVEYEKKGKEWKFVEIAIEIYNRFSAISALFPSNKTGKDFLELISNDILIVPYIQVISVKDDSSKEIGTTIRLGSRDELGSLQSK